MCIAPNVRGSTGYGMEFQKANYKDIGGGDLRDAPRIGRLPIGRDFEPKLPIGQPLEASRNSVAARELSPSISTR